MTRADKVTEARRLRAQGLTLVAIAERVGSTRSTVHVWLTDPDGSKQKARLNAAYGGICVDCGVPTSGQGGKGKAGKRCRPCHHQFEKDSAKWNRETVLAAIRRFADRYGRQPNATDFNPAHARTNGQNWRAERFYADGDYPLVPTVQKVFGTWNAAVEAAGYSPFSVSHYPRRSGPGGVRGAHLESEAA